MRALRAALPVLAATTSLAAPAAHAAEVAVIKEPSSNTAQVVVTAAPGEINHLVARYSLRPEESFVISDSNAGLTAGERCVGGGPPGSRVRCNVDPSFAFTYQLRIEAGDRNDSVRVAVGDALDGAEAMVDLGQGSDRYESHNDGGEEQIWPGLGDDDLTTAAGQNLIHLSGEGGGPDGADTIDGTVERLFNWDIVTYEGREDPLQLTLDSAANDGAPGEGDNLAGIDWLQGGAGDDTMQGDADSNTLWGGLGTDTLVGRRANDNLHGGGFERTEFGDFEGTEDPAGDILLGGSGPDTLDANSGDDQARGGKGRDDVYGGFGEDALAGGRGADYLDALYGFGRDFPFDAGADTVACGPGADYADAEAIDTPTDCEEVQGPPAPNQP